MFPWKGYETILSMKGKRLPAPRPAPEERHVLSKAVVRAAGLLGLTQRQLAEVLGVSEPTASRLAAGTYVLSPARAKEWELALLFVRLFRSLDAIWGREDSARKWLRSPNTALHAAPIELIGSIQGLVRVVGYLDSARGRL